MLLVGKFNPMVKSDFFKVKLVVVRILMVLRNSSLLFIRCCSKCSVIINSFNPHNNPVMGVLLLSCFADKETTAVQLAQAGERLDSNLGSRAPNPLHLSITRAPLPCWALCWLLA